MNVGCGYNLKKAYLERFDGPENCDVCGVYLSLRIACLLYHIRSGVYFDTHAATRTVTFISDGVFPSDASSFWHRETIQGTRSKILVDLESLCLRSRSGYKYHYLITI